MRAKWAEDMRGEQSFVDEEKHLHNCAPVFQVTLIMAHEFIKQGIVLQRLLKWLTPDERQELLLFENPITPARTNQFLR